MSYLSIGESNHPQIIDKQQTKTKKIREYFGHRVELDLVYLPGGNISIGSTECDDEQPINQVTVNSFAIGVYPIIQKQYQEIMGDNPSRFVGEYLPVESVSWFDAIEFCDKLSQQTGNIYTLPSEVQWEYAARSGTSSKYYCGDVITTDLANYNGDNVDGDMSSGIFRQQTTKVGSFPPNAFGLYDMSGNVWEWCLDEWHGNYHDAPSNDRAWLDPDRLQKNIARVKRGGSWNYYACSCTSSFRCSNLAANFAYSIGFRVVRKLSTNN